MKKKTNCGCIVFKCCIDTLCHVSIHYLYKSTERDEGTGSNYYNSVSQIILSIVDQETEFVAIPEYCLPS